MVTRKTARRILRVLLHSRRKCSWRAPTETGRLWAIRTHPSPESRDGIGGRREAAQATFQGSAGTVHLTHDASTPGPASPWHGPPGRFRPTPADASRPRYRGRVRLRRHSERESGRDGGGRRGWPRVASPRPLCPPYLAMRRQPTGRCECLDSSATRGARPRVLSPQARAGRPRRESRPARRPSTGHQR